MVLLNEFLPNPKGDDAKGEFIELANTDAKAVSLAGWSIKDKSGKTFRLSGEIPANGYRVLPRSLTHITLNNSDETLFLYNATGNKVDEAGFSGPAGDGMSFSRIGDIFLFTASATPGIPNSFSTVTASGTSSAFVSGTVAVTSVGSADVITICIAVAGVLAFAAARTVRQVRTT